MHDELYETADIFLGNIAGLRCKTSLLSYIREEELEKVLETKTGRVLEYKNR